MYAVCIISPTQDERNNLLNQGITMMCLVMVEGMHFETHKDAFEYMDEICQIYREISIKYKIYRISSWKK